MRRKNNDFMQAGAGLVLVGMGSVADSADFAHKQELPFPLISDPEGRLYTAFGLRKASIASLFSPTLFVKGVSALSQGYGVGRPIGDIRQLPGVFIIDTKGRIVFRHAAADASDHPDADTILDRLREVT